MAEHTNDLNDNVPIISLKLGETYSQIFLVVSSNRGFHGLEVVLKDITGTIRGIIWGLTKTIEPNQYIWAKGKVNAYSGKLSFSISEDSWRPTEPPPNIYDYVDGATPEFLSSCAGEIETLIEKMEDDDYRNILFYAMHELGLIAQLKAAPFEKHNYRGGLLIHIMSALAVAKTAIEQLKLKEIDFNPSLIIAGCILRNVGWYTTIISVDGLIRPRRAFFMTGIYRASFRYVNHLIMASNVNMPEYKIQALENLCNEYKDILTHEGKIVAQADGMASLLNET